MSNLYTVLGSYIIVRGALWGCDQFEKAVNTSAPLFIHTGDWCQFDLIATTIMTINTVLLQYYTVHKLN